MEGLVFMEAEHVFFFIFPWRNFLRDETEAEGGDIESLWVGTWCFCCLGQDQSSIYGTGFSVRDISQLCVFPVFSLLYAWCCAAHFTVDKCPSASHSPHSGFVPWQKHHLCHAVMEWLSCQATDQHEEKCLRLARKPQSFGLRRGRR